MTVLSDSSIKDLSKQSLIHDEENLIVPFNEFPQLQPASYDLRLGALERVNENFTKRMLYPGEFLLGSTLERVNLPANIVARIEGKSSLARKGLIIHTAGFVDPGFCGNLTLEITNLSRDAFPLEREMLIAQIAFQWLDKPAMRPYGHPELDSHYQGQQGVTHSRS